MPKSSKAIQDYIDKRQKNLLFATGSIVFVTQTASEVSKTLTETDQGKTFHVNHRKFSILRDIYREIQFILQKIKYQ